MASKFGRYLLYEGDLFEKNEKGRKEGNDLLHQPPTPRTKHEFILTSKKHTRTATNSDVLCHVVRAYVNHNTSCTYTTSYVHVATSTRGTNFLYSTAVRNYVYSCKDKF